MRLLDTDSLELTEHTGDIPDYVILSHMWGSGEVTFEDIDKPHAKEMLGYQKIRGSCQLARRDGFKWIWIDTCCIDKKSSAELSEAINSMYNWYWRAEICYAYLGDVPEMKDFIRSKWFKRGWTLQELLAPPIVEFYNQEWEMLGTRTRLVQNIQLAARIEAHYLLDRDSLRNANLATIFSWMTKRETKRPEDMSYCLLGLVEVNMPLLYGEGERAFFRLQLELLKQTTDHTMFAWDPLPGDVFATMGILAPSPRHFENASKLVGKAPIPWEHNQIYEMTNRGLRIGLPNLALGPLYNHMHVLNCQGADGSYIGLRLQKATDDQYCRLNGSKVSKVKLSCPPELNGPATEFIAAETRLRDSGISKHQPPIVQLTAMCSDCPGLFLNAIIINGKDHGSLVNLSHPDSKWTLDGLVIPHGAHACLHFKTDQTEFAIAVGFYRTRIIIQKHASGPHSANIHPFCHEWVHCSRDGLQITDVADFKMAPDLYFKVTAKWARFVSTGSDTRLGWKLTVNVQRRVSSVLAGTPSTAVRSGAPHNS